MGTRRRWLYFPWLLQLQLQRNHGEWLQFPSKINDNWSSNSTEKEVNPFETKQDYYTILLFDFFQTKGSMCNKQIKSQSDNRRVKQQDWVIVPI